MSGGKKLHLWSQQHPCCVRRESTDRPHMALGLCTRCYDAHTYKRNQAKERASRKLKRLRASEEKTAAVYKQQKTWKERNRDRALSSQREWYERRKGEINRWPIDSTVWIPFAGFWCEGRIVARLNNALVLVRLKGGTAIETGCAKNSVLRKAKPEGPVPEKLPRKYRILEEDDPEFEELLRSFRFGEAAKLIGPETETSFSPAVKIAPEYAWPTARRQA